MNRLTVWKKASSLGFAILLAGTLSGCVRDMDCPLAKEGKSHGHEYVTDNGFKTYRISEAETLSSGRFGDSLKWTNNVSDVNEDVQVMNALNLFRISDNVKELKKEIKTKVPYYEEEETSISISFDADGDMSISSSSSWHKIVKPEDPGTYHYVYYEYYACNIGRDDNGNPRVIMSPATNDIFSISNEYPYFHLGTYCKEVTVSYDPPQYTKKF